MTRFLRRSAWLAWALLAMSGIGLVVMILDSKPPFVMTGYDLATVRAGEVLRVNARVERDLTRRCSVVFSRHVFDRDGTRIDIVPDTYMPYAAIVELQKVSPNILRLAVPMPSYIKTGPATLIVPLSYVCNAWHALRPIETQMAIAFEVLP